MLLEAGSVVVDVVREGVLKMRVLSKPSKQAAGVLEVPVAVVRGREGEAGMAAAIAGTDPSKKAY
jgi:hypothetical protein